MVNELRFYYASKQLEAQKQGKPELAFEPVSIPMAKHILQVVLQGLRLVSEWNSRILLQVAWKLDHTNKSTDIQADQDYERAIRYNYKPNELSALIEVIAMMKGLVRLLVKQDTFLSPAIRTAIHAEVQEFVHVELADMFQDSSKKKKTTIRNDLTHLRNMVAEWLGGFMPFTEKTVKKNKSSASLGAQPLFPRRNVAPSKFQMELIRDIVFGLMHMRKEVSSANMKILEDFYQRSAFYQYALDLTGTALQCSDLGDLWFREFYLELSKALQFPISMSLPSILVQHVLDHSVDGVCPELLEYALFPLDIYNDAANRALYDLHQQYLYSEIEAEVNLCFDQLLFKLSNQVYTFYKMQAATILMDKPYLTQYETFSPDGHDRLSIPKSRFSTILSQRHVQLLGRTLDLNRLITQRINNLLRQNVDYAISRFEASDLSTIVELDMLLSNIRLTHKLLSEFLKLDSWDIIMRHGNESVSLGSYHNRILLHVLYEVASDFAPNYNYNNISDRFFRGPVEFAGEVERDNMPKKNEMFLFGNRALSMAYMPIFDNYKNIISTPHIVAIVHLLGRTNLPMLVNECLRNLDLKIQSVLAPYVTELTSGLPKSLKLPAFQYGTAGCHGTFQAKLTELITYPDLESEVFRHFKEMGNILVLLLKFDQVLKQHDLKIFSVSSAALGVTPETLQRGNTDEQTAQAPLVSVIRNTTTFLQSDQFPDCICSPPICRLLAENAVRADRMYRQPEQTISLFSTILRRINSDIDSSRQEWCGYDHKPANGVIDVEGPYEFYKLWCALQFVLCMPQQDIQHLAMYGDGINWAACTIIYLLGQRHRFEAFSFTSHTLDIEDASEKRSDDPQLVQFLRNAVYDREVNREVFSILETYYPVSSFNSELVLSVPTTLTLNYNLQFKAAAFTESVDTTPAAAAAPPAPVARAPVAPPAPEAPAPELPDEEEEQLEIPPEEEEYEEQPEVPPEEEEDDGPPPMLPSRGYEEEEEQPEIPPDEDEEEQPAVPPEEEEYEEQPEVPPEEEEYEEQPEVPPEEEEDDGPPPMLPSRGYEEEEEQPEIPPDEEEEEEEAPPPPPTRGYEEEEGEYEEEYQEGEEGEEVVEGEEGYEEGYEEEEYQEGEEDAPPPPLPSRR